MKRTKLKRGTKQMKRGTLKKKSPTSLAKQRTKLWELCKQIVRKKYPPVCYTCGKPVSGSNDHTSHFIPSAACGAFLRYDLRNLRRCCYNCNVNLGGNGAMFYWKLVREVGAEEVEQIFRDKQVVVKADRTWYDQKIAEYEKILAELL